MSCSIFFSHTSQRVTSWSRAVACSSLKCCKPDTSVSRVCGYWGGGGGGGGGGLSVKTCTGIFRFVEGVEEVHTQKSWH